MKLLKAVAEAMGSLARTVCLIAGLGIFLAALSGMITFGCTKAFWYDQTTCTMTMIFNSLK